MEEANLTPIDVARIACCHPNTVKNYARKGFITPARDINNFFRFTLAEAEKLRDLLSARWAESNKQDDKAIT